MGVVLAVVVAVATFGLAAAVVGIGLGFVADAVVVADAALASLLRMEEIVHILMPQDTMTFARTHLRGYIWFKIMLPLLELLVTLPLLLLLLMLGLV